MLCLCLKSHVLTLKISAFKTCSRRDILVDISLFMESVLGQKESSKLKCDSLYTAPGQGCLPTAEPIFSGHNNFEKCGRCADNLTELYQLNGLANSPSCPAAKHYSKWQVEHKYKCTCISFFFQFLSDCVWQASVPTCFCTLHGRKPSPGTKPGKNTPNVQRKELCTHDPLQLSQRRCEISYHI